MPYPPMSERRGSDRDLTEASQDLHQPEKVKTSTSTHWQPYTYALGLTTQGYYRSQTLRRKLRREGLALWLGWKCRDG